MAYISRIYKEEDYTYDELYDLLCQFLVDIGWVLHDSFDNSKVYKNQSSKNDRPYVYLVLTHTTNSSSVGSSLYLYWNSTTHTGTIKAYKLYDSLSITTNAGRYLRMYGDKDYFFIDGNSYYNKNDWTGVLNFIYFTDLWDDTHTTILSAVSQAYSATVHVADTSGFIVGRLYQLVGANGEGRDAARKVTAIIDATHLMLDDVPQDYSAGSFLGVAPCPAGMNVNYVPTSLYSLCGKLKVGSEEPTSADYLYLKPFGETIYADPSGPYQRHILLPIAVIETDTYTGYLGIFDNEYLAIATSITFDCLGVRSGQTIAGYVDTATTNTITDTSESWVANSLTGKYVIITEGIGIYQIRKITSNTVNTFTVGSVWFIDLDDTSKYEIVDEAWRSYYYNICCREIL